MAPSLPLTLDDLTKEEKHLLSFALNEPGDFVNLPYAIGLRADEPDCKGKVSKDAVDKRVRRASQRLVHRGLATASKEDDGLIWIRVKRKSVVDLIRASAKIQPAKTGPSDTRPKKSPFAIPSNARQERLMAIRHLLGLSMVGKDDDQELRNHFGEYLDRIDGKIIALQSTKDDGEIVGAEYSTRFNDQRRVLRNLDRFDFALEESTKRYCRAVFLTLTTDPKRHKSIWHANRNMTKAWNKFMAYVTKRLGGRPKYLASFEFTKSGLIHVHALMFVPYLVDHAEITAEWERCNQGTINYIYSLTNRNGRWVWLKGHKPKDAKAMDGGTYLKKYLKKCLFATRDGAYSDDSPVYMYWAINKRFWTCSRCLTDQTKADPADDEEKEPQYRYVGCLDDDDADIIDRMIYERLGPPEAVT